jgi:DNA-directed RNA polymerase subunit H
MSTAINVLNHVMVPEHVIMTQDEIDTLLTKYQITFDHLPKIYHDDPAVVQVEAKMGDVVRIIRKSQTAGRAESYRYVVKRPKK